RAAGACRGAPAHRVATTPPPGPAGHDRFPADLIEEHLGPLRDALGLSHEKLMGLGRVYATDPSESFCMTVLALQVSRRANGVSALHGRVSRALWSDLRAGRAEDQGPLGHHTQRGPAPAWPGRAVASPPP